MQDVIVRRKFGRRNQEVIARIRLPWSDTSVEVIRTDATIGVTLLACCFYFWAFNPAVLVAAGICSTLALAFNVLNRSAQVLPLRVWHLYALVLGVATIWGQSNAPALAQFFNALEEAIISVIDQAGTGISADLISTIFIFFRILIVLAFIVGVIVAISQATRGNDWQSIANLLGVGVAFVIGVEVITQLILGGVGG